MALSLVGHADSYISIDLEAVSDNWRYIDSLSSAGTRTAAVVKANGYGLGANEVAKSLTKAGCKMFFVANLDEGIALRQSLSECNGWQPIITTLHGYHSNQQDGYQKYKIAPVLNDPEQLSQWRVFSQNQSEPLPALIHFDTGMNRLGFDPDQSDWLVNNKSAIDGIRCLAIMSHLASAEIYNDPQNAVQLAAFSKIRSSFVGMPSSLANSAGCLLSPDYHFQITRPGIALYGVHPAGQLTYELKPVVRWLARILQIREAKAGDSVGYGGTHLLTRNSLIATIGVGYADGYNRKLGGKARVLIGTQSAPVIGRISMDSTSVDVTDIDHTHLLCGNVELLHDGYNLSNMAADSGTISYEILTKIGNRPNRQYQNA